MRRVVWVCLVGLCVFVQSVSGTVVDAKLNLTQDFPDIYSDATIPLPIVKTKNRFF